MSKCVFEEGYKTVCLAWSARAVDRTLKSKSQLTARRLAVPKTMSRCVFTELFHVRVHRFQPKPGEEVRRVRHSASAVAAP